MKLSSSDFAEGEEIPKRFTCHGEDISPELVIENVPPNANCLALIVDDPDAPNKTWVHWVLYNIPITDKIEQGSIPGDQGHNDFQQQNYGGPCPPSGTHRYYFKLYALDTNLDIEKPCKETLLEAMKGHILAEAELMGRFTKPS